ncbi:aminoglycoside phosphotransferase [Alicyclobacillus hesperidum]|uniref:Aminoglycoside phosphotransferase n=1 Tax=Alicyclobacillus hesperidum TaxID=89784 RepID=A0AA37TZ84_9BACL|nr:phosphotransferase family protein [Alicyclobacillus hesperidum]GLV13922.1 aminoglycoside phosphotransferase [Alicyclobacillus hesperidum]
MNIHDIPGTIAVRSEDAFDTEAVRAYLVREKIIPSDQSANFEVVQFPTGASNLTYLLQCGSWMAVLRRPPHGPLPPRAHDMKRESAFLARLHPHFPKAPQPYAFCEDTTIMGVPFFLMEYRKGICIDTAFPSHVPFTPEKARAVGEQAVHALVELHNVDIAETGLHTFGHPDGFLRRQVEGWMERFRRSSTGESVPGADALMTWLARNIPDTHNHTVIHNDFKLNNLLFESNSLAEVVGIVDWEMATIGDPLFDLGVMLSYWVEASDPEPLRSLLPSATALPGFLRRDEVVHIYARTSGRSVDHVNFYYVLGTFKLAVIVQQIYVRYKMGKTTDSRFAHFGDAVRTLIEHAVYTAGV